MTTTDAGATPGEATRTRAPRVRIGCQGWNYPAWVGPFYPARTKPKDFLATYAKVFDTVEIDSSWYATPDARHVERWADAVPPGFLFCPKLSREITHERRLVDCRKPLDHFIDTMRVLTAQRKLGPILIQCDESLAPTEQPAVDAFLRMLPTDLRFAIEFRHPGWFTAETHAMLSHHHVAWAQVSARWIPRRWMLRLGERPTGAFRYIRWLGPDRTIEDYSHEHVDRSGDLAVWADMIESLTAAVPVYALVNNHYEGHSPGTVRKLQRLLHLPVVEPEDLTPQMGLFQEASAGRAPRRWRL